MTIIGFIGGPVIKGLIDAYNLHVQAGVTDNKTAADLAGKELAVQQAQEAGIVQYRMAEIGHPFEPDKLMGYFVALYLGKLLVWDKVMGLGVTDPLAGWAETTSNLIVSFYFVKRGAENVAKIIAGVKR